MAQSPQKKTWLHTGDIGEMDAEGNLYFKGRKKNVIVTPAGMNVYPEDLEAVLRRQPEIRDCVVVADRDGDNAEAYAALLLRDSNTDAQTAVDRANVGTRRIPADAPLDRVAGGGFPSHLYGEAAHGRDRETH